MTLILGDNIFYGEQLKEQLIDSDNIVGGKVFAVEVDNPKIYGVIQKDSSGNVEKIIEKPENPPTNLAVTGLYCYDNKVVEVAKSLKPSKRGELEITDLNNAYLEKSSLKVCVLDNLSSWFDTGNFDSLLKASTFIKETQEKTGEMIGAIELVACINGWITKDKLAEVLSKFKNSGYSDKLLASVIS